MIDLDAMNKDQWQTWPVKKEELRGLVHEIERLRDALLESNSLLAAMTLETRPLDEICEQIMQNRAALEGEKTDV